MKEVVKLSDLIQEVSIRNKDNNYPVLSVSKDGFKKEYFTKQIHSVKTDNYKLVQPNQFAYNPARINIGSIALNRSNEIGIVSPFYVVFKK